MGNSLDGIFKAILAFGLLLVLIIVLTFIGFMDIYFMIAALLVINIIALLVMGGIFASYLETRKKNEQKQEKTMLN